MRFHFKLKLSGFSPKWNQIIIISWNMFYQEIDMAHVDHKNILDQLEF